MSVYVCSLLTNTSQSIPSSAAYTSVKFEHNTESSDLWDMHPLTQPDGGTSSNGAARSALIWPTVAGWATLEGYVVWDYNANWAVDRETRSQFIRDPLNLTTGADSTVTADHAKTPGGQYVTRYHGLFAVVNTPLAFQIKQESGYTSTISHAQFKVAIESDVAYP